MSEKVNRKVRLSAVTHVTVLNAIKILQKDRRPSTSQIRGHLGMLDSSYDMGQKLWGMKQASYITSFDAPHQRGNVYELTDKGAGYLALNTEYIQSTDQLLKDIELGTPANKPPPVKYSQHKAKQGQLLDVTPIEPPAPQFSTSANAAMDEIAPLLDKSVALEKALDDIAGILGQIQITDITLENPKEITAIRKFMPAVADLMTANNVLAKRLHEISELLPEIKPQETTAEEA